MVVRRQLDLTLILIAFCLCAGLTARASSIWPDSRPPQDTLRVRDAGSLGLSIRTNLLYAGTSTPNLGLEFPVGQHLTLGISGALKSWPRWLPWDRNVENPLKWRHLLVSPDLRWWPDDLYTGWFFGGSLVYLHYNLGAIRAPFGLYPVLQEHRVQGDFYGAALSAGHAWRLGRSWRLELEAGVAAGYADATRYECAHCGAQTGTDQGPLIVPKLGINLAWSIPGRRRPAPVEVVPAVTDTLVPPQEVPAPVRAYPAPVVPRIGPTERKAPGYPMLQPGSEYRPYTPDRVMRKEPGALCVYFAPGRTDLRREFTYFERHRDNGPVLDEILEATRAVLADSTSRISRIQIVGFASIDADPARNERLAYGRALTLQRFIQDQLGLPDEAFDTVSGAEAWGEFRDQVCDLIQAGGGEGLTVEELRAVLEVLDGEPDPVRREQRLVRLDRGTIYPKLARSLLQDQRNAGYVHIYYDALPDAAAEAINEAIGKLEAGEYAAALRQLEPWRDDPRSTRAYAAALFYTGSTDRAYALLREAARTGDSGAGEDLVRLQEYEKQRAAREEYLRLRDEYNRLINQNH